MQVTFLPKAFALLIVFVGIWILAVALPLNELLIVYLLVVLVVSAILSLIFVYRTPVGSKFLKSNKSLKIVVTIVLVTIGLFWLFTQINQTPIIIALEFKYHNVVSEYSQFLSSNPADELNSSWAVVVKYKNEFDGTYGRNEILPNRELVGNSVYPIIFNILYVYLVWFDGYGKLVVLQKKGNCEEFAIAIKTLLRDAAELKTRTVSMEGVDHAYPEVYWNGSWWVFDAIFTTPEYPVKAGDYAEYLKENKLEYIRNVYECLSNLKESETGKYVLAEHGFDVVNVTISAIIDPLSGNADDKPAENANIEIFALKNCHDPLVDRGKTDREGKYQTVLRSYGDYVILAKSGGLLLGVLEIDGSDLKSGDEIVVRLHKYG